MRSLFATACSIAAEQHARVARRQLLAAGIDTHRIQRWLADGRLHRVHQGVYAIGQPIPSLHADYMAAVLACGNESVLSHLPAGQILKTIRTLGILTPEVTIPTTARRIRAGIVVHRVRELHPRDISVVDDIPITTVPRTLLDLAPRLSPDDLARAHHEAWIHYRVTPGHVLACIERNPGKPGAARLRAAIGSDVTLSKLEDRFLSLLRVHGLPLPRTNIDHRGDKVDCHWPHVELTVELVSYRFHGSRHAFEADVARRRRSRHLAFSWGDVVERGVATARELAPLLRGEY